MAKTVALAAPGRRRRRTRRSSGKINLPPRPPGAVILASADDWRADIRTSLRTQLDIDVEDPELAGEATVGHALREHNDECVAIAARNLADVLREQASAREKARRELTEADFYVDDDVLQRLDLFERLAADLIGRLSALTWVEPSTPIGDVYIATSQGLAPDRRRGPKQSRALTWAANSVNNWIRWRTGRDRPDWQAVAKVLAYQGWDIGMGSWKEKGERVRKQATRRRPQSYLTE